jgi:hypothetical protein
MKYVKWIQYLGMHNCHATCKFANRLLFLQLHLLHNGVQERLFVADPIFQRVQFVLDFEQMILDHLRIQIQNQQSSQ